ncbi:MAG: MaoC/PaaZ C-terminal domain-containing protein [Sediminibacterium sp.]|nr:MaoC/PaaZ C-terminal domain-containing protein [Sediminibacterium sp.]
MLSAYTKISENRYREIYGLDFEQFEKGQIFVHRPGITVSQQDNKNEALSTFNHAQLHYDANYAAHTEWKKCLVVSTLTIGKIIGMTWKTFARKGRIENFKSIAMVHPVFDGDTIYSESEIKDIINTEDANFGKLIVETRGFNQENILISKIEYTIQMYRKGFHPYYSFVNQELQQERFSAYKMAENKYMEQSGLYFEDFNEGEIFEHYPHTTFYNSESVERACHSLEWNPKYTDHSYQQKYLKNHISNPIQELYAVTMSSTHTTRTLGKVVANLEWKNIEIAREIGANEELYSISEIMAKRESKSRPTQGILTVNTKTFDANNNLVISFERVLLVYKKGCGPYTNSNY